MVFVIDTNVIVSSIVNPKFEAFFDQTYLQFSHHEFIVSVVTEGELEALALKRKWGKKKLNQLAAILEKHLIYPIKLNTVIDTYAQIDAYSQGVLENKPLPSGMSARNMGKNDIWIAATAQVVQGTLITTDKDFDHLADVYFPIDLVNIGDFK